MAFNSRVKKLRKVRILRIYDLRIRDSVGVRVFGFWLGVSV